MTHNQIRAAIRRAKFRLVNGNNVAGHNSRKYSKSLNTFNLQVDHSISYQTLPSNEDQSKTAQIRQVPDIIGQNFSGTTPASVPRPMARENIAVNPIANAPRTTTPVDSEIPDNYQFEIYRLRARVAELECVIQDKNDRLRHCLATLEDELLFWNSYFHDHVGETLGQLQQRVGRLESTLAFLKDIQPHVIPTLEIPAKWRR